MIENNNIPNSSGNQLGGKIPNPENPAAPNKTGFQPRKFAKVVQIIAFVGIPLVLVLGILEHFQKSSFEESLSRERQDMQEILTQTASRGNIQKNYNSLFERLSQIPWTQQNFMTKFAEIYKTHQGIIDLYLFDRTGKRLFLPGFQDTSPRAVSEKFFKAIADPKSSINPNVITSFAGNPESPKIIGDSPGLLKDLLNGDRRTWGGWWPLSERGGNIIGHVVVFVHRGSISPEQVLDEAVEKSNKLVVNRFILGWKSPTGDKILRPLTGKFPDGFLPWLLECPPSQNILEFSGNPVVFHPTDDGKLIFCLSKQNLKENKNFGTLQGLFIGLAILAGGISLLAPPLRSLKSKLVIQFLVGGGIPLAVFLGTVNIDRQDRENLLVEKIQQEQLHHLMKIDGELFSEYLPIARKYKQLLDQLSRKPLNEGIEDLKTLGRWARKQDDVIKNFNLVTKEGMQLYFENFIANLPVSQVKKSGEVLGKISGNVINYINASNKNVKSESAESILVDLLVETKSPYHWYIENGLFKLNQIGKEPVMTFFELIRGKEEVFRGIFFAMHNGWRVQIRYLRELVKNWKIPDKNSPIFLAIPISPGGDWPAFPRAKSGNIHPLRKMKDLILSTGIPQHKVLRIGRQSYLLSAIRGQNIDGYVLMIAQPYQTILDQTFQLNFQAAGLAIFMFFLAGGIAWLTSKTLLEPISELNAGLTALRERNFHFAAIPGQISELAIVADRFNLIMEGLQDMKMARSVQEALWPGHGLSGDGWQIDGKCVTATNLGGDHHDWFQLPDGRVVIAIGDVAGHGISSALVAASAKTLLALSTEGNPDPALVLNLINQSFHAQGGRTRPMSFWLGIYEPVKRKMKFSCAGHNFPIAVIKGEIIEAGVIGYPLGARKNYSFKSGDLDFSGGGRLYLYTDGLIEAHNSIGEPFGYDRFKEATVKNRGLSPKETLSLVFEKVTTWSGRENPEDDQTLIILETGGEQ